VDVPSNQSRPEGSARAYRPVWFLFAILGALVLIAGISRWTAPREIVPWRSDFAAAQRESSTAGKPVMLYLTAEWCGPCQSLKGTTWADPTVERALRAYVPVKIDVDQHPDLARQYGSDAIPRFVVLGKDGQIVKATEGALPPAEFLAWLNG
jgi:thiol:disulfide interchange protein